MGFSEFLSSLNKFVSKLDAFAYIPAFYIKREPEYKSSLGGYVYIGYLLFMASFVVYSLYNYVQLFNQINSIKENLSKSDERNFTSSDIQFGVGLLDHDGKNLYWNDFPQLEVIVNSYYNNKKSSFNLSYCREDLMYSNDDLNQMSQQDQISTKNLLNSYYKCPDNTFNVTLIPRKLFISKENYFEIIVKIKNLSMLNSTINLIQSKRPSIQLIWGSFAFVFNNFLNPISKFIDDTLSYLRNNTISNSEIFLEPLILKDNQIFGNTFIPFRAEINKNQKDGALFNVIDEKIYDEDILDRSIIMENDENLILKRYQFKLDFQTKEISRYRTVFLTFLTTLTSIPSTVLIILILIMEKVNVTLAKNHLFKGLFSLNYFKNISSFRSEYLRKYCV